MKSRMRKDISAIVLRALHAAAIYAEASHSTEWRRRRKKGQSSKKIFKKDERFSKIDKNCQKAPITLPALKINAMNLYRIFREFLEERGCKKAFDQAFALQNPGYVLDAALWDILGGDEFFLGRAFDWSETPEGRDFWKEIDLAWEQECGLV